MGNIFDTLFELEKSLSLMLKAGHRGILSTQTCIWSCNQKNSYKNEMEPQTPLIPHYLIPQPQVSL
ncbi:hypothetical protein HanPSC8_Chr10g0407211 [Helianthus annuus]|nr:hypothetical protein HanPSC8_Chr10g0407211 [Helianthus annuus]